MRVYEKSSESFKIIDILKEKRYRIKRIPYKTTQINENTKKD